MSDEPKPPKRRNSLTLDIGADSLPELLEALEQISVELSDSGNQTVSGSPSWGGHWEHVVRLEQTPERFRAQLAAYLHERREISAKAKAAVERLRASSPHLSEEEINAEVEKAKTEGRTP